MALRSLFNNGVRNQYSMYKSLNKIVYHRHGGVSGSALGLWYHANDARDIIYHCHGGVSGSALGL